MRTKIADRLPLLPMVYLNHVGAKYSSVCYIRKFKSIVILYAIENAISKYKKVTKFKIMMVLNDTVVRVIADAKDNENIRVRHNKGALVNF